MPTARAPGGSVPVPSWPFSLVCSLGQNRQPQPWLQIALVGCVLGQNLGRFVSLDSSDSQNSVMCDESLSLSLSLLSQGRKLAQRALGQAQVTQLESDRARI